MTVLSASPCSLFSSPTQAGHHARVDLGRRQFWLERADAVMQLNSASYRISR